MDCPQTTWQDVTIFVSSVRLDRDLGRVLFRYQELGSKNLPAGFRLPDMISVRDKNEFNRTESFDLDLVFRTHRRRVNDQALIAFHDQVTVEIDPFFLREP